MVSTGGHGDPPTVCAPELMGNPGVERGVANSPEEAARVVRQRVTGESYDLIKTSVTGGVLSLAKSGDAPLWSGDEVSAIVKTAKDYSFPSPPTRMARRA